MLSIPQMLWLVETCAREGFQGTPGRRQRSAQVGRARGCAAHSRTVRRRAVRGIATDAKTKGAGTQSGDRDLKQGRLESAWQKLDQHGVIKELRDAAALRKRAVEQHLAGLRAGKTSLMICPRHEEARKVATIVRQKLKAEGAIGTEDHAVTVLSRMDLGPESHRDSYTMRQAEWSDSTRGRREGSSPVRSGPCPELIVKLLRSSVMDRFGISNLLPRVSGTFSFPRPCKSA